MPVDLAVEVLVEPIVDLEPQPAVASVQGQPREVLEVEASAHQRLLPPLLFPNLLEPDLVIPALEQLLEVHLELNQPQEGLAQLPLQLHSVHSQIHKPVPLDQPHSPQPQLNQQDLVELQQTLLEEQHLLASVQPILALEHLHQVLALELQQPVSEHLLQILVSVHLHQILALEVEEPVVVHLAQAVRSDLLQLRHLLKSQPLGQVQRALEVQEVPQVSEIMPQIVGLEEQQGSQLLEFSPNRSLSVPQQRQHLGPQILQDLVPPILLVLVHLLQALERKRGLAHQLIQHHPAYLDQLRLLLLAQVQQPHQLDLDLHPSDLLKVILDLEV